jgi:hypothetical protein
MMNKTKLAFAALLLLQIAPAAQAAKHPLHSNGSALSAYDYAREVYGWDGGLYPFNLTPGSSRPIPLRSGDRCWGSMGNGKTSVGFRAETVGPRANCLTPVAYPWMRSSVCGL